jgi:hypothetical protein
VSERLIQGWIFDAAHVGYVRRINLLRWGWRIETRTGTILHRSVKTYGSSRAAWRSLRGRYSRLLTTGATA